MNIDVSIEPVTGWRFWGLATDPSGHTRCCCPRGLARRLAGPATIRGPLRRGRPVGTPVFADVRHESPSLGCTCGIYASASLRDLPTSTPSLPGAERRRHRLDVGTHDRARARVALAVRLPGSARSRVRRVSAVGVGRGDAGGGRPRRVRATHGWARRGLRRPPRDGRGGGVVPAVRSTGGAGPAARPLRGRSDAVRRRADALRAAPAAAPVRQWPTAVAPPVPSRPAAGPLFPAVNFQSAPPAPAVAASSPAAKDPLWLRVARGAWEVVSFCIGLAFVASCRSPRCSRAS